MSEIRHILSGDRAWALYSLRDRPVWLWQDVLEAEQRRRRPRKLLIAALQRKLATAGASGYAGDMTPDEAARGAQKGNQNAAKDDAFDTVIRVRCHQQDKGKWNKRAREAKMDLSEWMRTALNAAADSEN